MEINLNEEKVAEGILNAVSNSLAAKLIQSTILKHVVKQDDIERAFNSAAQEVTKELFLDFLRKDVSFRERVHAEVTKLLDDALIDKLIKSLTSRIY